eukprot:jgi/Ulvmu1/6846/UM031_0051.1
MADDEIDKLSFRDAQKRCKDLGLKSGGKLIDLQQRIRDHLSGEHSAEPVVQEPSTPTFAGASGSPLRATPSAEQRTRAIARQAMTMATSTPLPQEYAPKQVAPTGDVPGQAKSKNWGLPVVFMFLSAVIAAVTMYTYRIDWKPILHHAKSSDIQAGVREYTKQASTLYKGDVEIATTTFYSTKEALVAAPDTIKAYYDGYVANMTGGASKEPPSRNCQTPPTEGLKFLRGGPTMVISSETEETLGGFFRFLTDCSNTWQRKISVSYAADFEHGEDPVEVAERVMDKFGCNDAEYAKGHCLLVDIAALSKRGGSQGAALQAVLAKQLRLQPSTLILMVNLESLDDSGAAVMLNLTGEFGMLNEPDCDIETRFSAQLLMAERTPGDARWPFEKLEQAWAAKLDNGQETALALRRRIADLPVRIKSKDAKYGSAKAAAALAAANKKLKADAEEAEAAEQQKAAAEKAAADAATKEKAAAAAAAAKAAAEAAAKKKAAADAEKADEHTEL